MSESVAGARRRPSGAGDRPAFGFDLDGVLMVNPFDSCVVPRLEALVAGAPALAGLSTEETSREVRRAIGRGWRERMAAGDLAAAYDWDSIYLAVAAEFGIPDADERVIDVARWVRECCQEGGHIRALPGAEETLTDLAASGARLVVISNGFAPYQEPVLEALGLLRHFDEVVTPDRVGYAKPDRRIFEAAGPLDAFVGDTLVHDVLGARQAGIEAVWLHPGLPAELRSVGPRERAVRPEVADLVRASLVASPHAVYHPEADLETCSPDAVATSLSEVRDLLLGSAATRPARR